MGKLFSTGKVSKISDTFLRLSLDCNDISVNDYLVAESESKIGYDWQIGSSFIGSFDEGDGFGKIWVIPEEGRDAWLNDTWQEYLSKYPEIKEYLDNVYDENPKRLTIIFG